MSALLANAVSYDYDDTASDGYDGISGLADDANDYAAMDEEENKTGGKLSGIDTSQVTSMEQVFFWCSSLTSLDVSGFDTGNVKNMRYMFGSCCSLTSLDVSGFDMSNVENSEDMPWDTIWE